MNRVKIKENAKKMIKGNLWHLWKPQVIFALIEFAIGAIVALILLLTGVGQETMEKVVSLVSTPMSIIEVIFLVGFSKYCLDFVRGKKSNMKEIWEFIKKNWVVSLLISLLVAFNVAFGMILLIVPGIMAAIGLSFYREVCADNPELKTTAIARKAWKITNGYKMDLFIMGLSFLGWLLLVPITLGLLMIWLTPYMTISFTLAYEELKKAAE